MTLENLSFVGFRGLTETLLASFIDIIDEKIFQNKFPDDYVGEQIVQFLVIFDHEESHFLFPIAQLDFPVFVFSMPTDEFDFGDGFQVNGGDLFDCDCVSHEFIVMV